MRPIPSSALRPSLILPILLLAIFAGAKPPARPATDSSGHPVPIEDPDTRHKGLRDLRETMERALNGMLIDTLLEHVTDDVIFTTMNGDVARGKDGVRKYFESMMSGPDKRVEKVVTRFEADERSRFLNEEVAVAAGVSHDQYVLAGGKAFDIKARWTATMKIENTKWKVAAFHYSVNVFDNPILDAQKMIYTAVAAVAGVVGILVGFFVGRTRRK